MPIADAYASVAEYRAALSSPDTGADAKLERNLKSVSRYLDWKLGQRTSFNLDVAATTRLYDGAGAPDLTIDAVASKVGLVVTVDDDGDGVFDHDTALVAGEFELRPLNAPTGADERPWTWLHLPTRASRSIWPHDVLIQVEAIHGWPRVPDAIKDAVIELTGMLRVESVFATMQIQQIDAGVQASPQARSILKGLYQQYRAVSPLAVMA